MTPFYIFLNFRIRNKSSGYIPGALPYSELKISSGNETLFLNINSFELMNYVELVTDHSVLLRVERHLRGLLLQGVPGLKPLDWRLVATANVLYSSLLVANLKLLMLNYLWGNIFIRV